MCCFGTLLRLWFIIFINTDGVFCVGQKNVCRGILLDTCKRDGCIRHVYLHSIRYNSFWYVSHVFAVQLYLLQFKFVWKPECVYSTCRACQSQHVPQDLPSIATVHKNRPITQQCAKGEQRILIPVLLKAGTLRF